MQRIKLTTFLAFFVLSACGGGGGGSPAPPAPSAYLKITPANAADASKASYEAALASTTAADRIATYSTSAGSAPGLSKPRVDGALTGTLLRALEKIPLGPEISPCAVSGSIIISGDVDNLLTLTEGDELLIEADNCDDGLGEIVDGAIAFTVTAFSGDLLSGRFMLTITVTLSDLQVTTADDVITTNGDAALTLDTTALPLVSASVSGDALTVDSNTRSATLSGYATGQTVDASASPAAYTLESGGTLDSTELAGLVSYSTPVTFAGILGGFPQNGELLVSGDDSSARLIALDAVNVLIEIDSDGDGTVDETIETTWEELVGS